MDSIEDLFKGFKNENGISVENLPSYMNYLKHEAESRFYSKFSLNPFYVENDTKDHNAKQINEDVESVESSNKKTYEQEEIKTKKNDVEQQKRFIQPSYEPQMCNCFDILARVYKDLIYHSHRASHVGKQVFFTLKYGLLLILMKDYINAIIILTEARELCFNDSVSQSTNLSGVFRKVIIGKIEVGLAKAYLEIRQLRATRNHLAIALRQYNIPSVSLTYKHFSHLLTRSFLVNTRRVKPFVYKNTVIRSDLAACMNTCTKLFILEGNWKMTKLTSAYSLYLVRTLNNKVELLCESYCSAIDIARYTENYHVCLKLQKFAVRDLQLNYAYNLTYNMYSLNTLLGNILEIVHGSGDISRAIRIGYRVLDISLKIPAIVTMARTISSLSILLLFNFRIIDCGDLCKLLKNMDNPSGSLINLLVYHTLNLVAYRRAGFLVSPIDETIDFATKYFLTKVRFNWQEYNFITLIYVHFLMMGNYDRAEEWKHSLSFNSVNVKRRIVFVTLIYTLEAKMILYMRSRRLQNLNVKIEEKVITNLLELTSSQLKNFPLHVPLYLCLKAWMCILNKKKRTAFKLLKKAQKVCTKQENYLYYAFVTQLKNSWNGGFAYQYHNRPALNYKKAIGFSSAEWAQFISPYPIDF